MISEAHVWSEKTSVYGYKSEQSIFSKPITFEIEILASLLQLDDWRASTIQFMYF
jgi:hypothetical protein